MNCRRKCFCHRLHRRKTDSRAHVRPARGSNIEYPAEIIKRMGNSGWKDVPGNASTGSGGESFQSEGRFPLSPLLATLTGQNAVSPLLATLSKIGWGVGGASFFKNHQPELSPLFAIHTPQIAVSPLFAIHS